MTENHLITPPLELVQQWIKEATDPDYEQRIATQLAGPTPEGPTDEPMIPDHYRGDDIRVYREGFHAGYKYAFQLMEKHSDV